jgi:hypothetical protein
MDSGRTGWTVKRLMARTRKTVVGRSAIGELAARRRVVRAARDAGRTTLRPAVRYDTANPVHQGVLIM